MKNSQESVSGSFTLGDGVQRPSALENTQCAYKVRYLDGTYLIMTDYTRLKLQRVDVLAVPGHDPLCDLVFYNIMIMERK